MLGSLFALGAACATAVLAPGDVAVPDGFTLHARFVGIGGCLKTLVGPGPEPDSERIYASHIYGGDVLDIVAVDPQTGHTDAFPSPIPGEIGAWAMTLGPDGQIYVGTLPTAHVLRLDWAERRLVDMSRPSETEQYIWQLALGSDGRLYGCTYPEAKLVRYDPATGRGEDLGRMDPVEQYARNIAADAAGFVYVGIGTVQRNIVSYEIATGEHRSVLPPECAGPGTCSVALGDDGVVYAGAGDKHLRLSGFEATVIPAGEVHGAPALALADGRLVTYDGRSVTLRDPQTNAATELATGYEGKSQSLFRIGLGPDGMIYGSTAMPIHFIRANPDSDEWEELGRPGGGEFYSFLAHEDVLIGAAYSGDAPVMIYHPGQAWAPAAEPTGNPWLVHYPEENAGWRPMAQIHGADGKVYIGAVSGYGLLGGPLCVFDPAAGTVEQHLQLIQDQSVVALAALPDGRIVGGTTIGGGGGSRPTQAEAKVFLWDPATKQVVFQAVPVPGAGSIQALAVAKDGLVYGFADATLFILDPAQPAVIETAEHSLGGVIYNAIGPGPDGELYGLTSHSIFTIDTAMRRPRVIAEYPDGITGGFAIKGRDVFLLTGPQIVSYRLP